jgi:hypothetical protein
MTCARTNSMKFATRFLRLLVLGVEATRLPPGVIACASPLREPDAVRRTHPIPLRIPRTLTSTIPPTIIKLACRDRATTCSSEKWNVSNGRSERR